MIDEIQKYLEARYEYGARGAKGAFDCWGLVRDARHKIYGRDLLASLDDIGGSRVISKDKALGRLGVVEIPDPIEGSIAAVFRGPLFVHVGLIVFYDGELSVLEANPHAIQIAPLWEFLELQEVRGLKVAFYD